jgi:hypothetical protein
VTDIFKEIHGTAFYDLSEIRLGVGNKCIESVGSAIFLKDKTWTA